MIFGKKNTVKKEKTIHELMADRVVLEKEIEVINGDILKLQIKCPHENFGDFDRLDGTGYTVCTDCYAELARLY